MPALHASGSAKLLCYSSFSLLGPVEVSGKRLAEPRACTCLLATCRLPGCSDIQQGSPVVVLAEQVAEGERDSAVAKLACYTPRPAAPLGSLTALLGPTLALRLSDAVAAHR